MTEKICASYFVSDNVVRTNHLNIIFRAGNSHFKKCINKYISSPKSLFQSYKNKKLNDFYVTHTFNQKISSPKIFSETSYYSVTSSIIYFHFLNIK